MIELLENRTLCSTTRHAHPVFSLDHGVLNVSGSYSRDIISIGMNFAGGRQLSRKVLRLNGVGYAFAKTITRINIYGGAGRDLITNDLYLSSEGDGGVYINGGDDSDELNTAFGPDTLIGSAGNDVLNRYAGNGVTQCYMDGGPGNDTLTNGTTMYGGSGTDTATLDPSAAADYNDYPYVGLVTTGGIEQYQNTSSPYFEEYPNLSSRGGNLVLTYRPLANDQSISVPTVRDDGKVAVTVKTDYKNPVTRPDDTLWTVRFTASQTARARQHGLLLIIKRPDVGTISLRELLIPQV